MTATAQLLDISGFQGKFDVKHAKATIPNLVGIIYKLTQGNYYVNPDAQYQHDAVQAEGLAAGGYHFLDPAIDGAEQCTYFMDEYTKLGMTETSMHWLDNETAKAGISAHQTSLVAQAFMTERQKLAPYNPHGVYSFVDFIKYGYCQGLGEYDLWLAFPAAKAPSVPPEWTRWTVWQWGTRDGGTDADAFNGTVGQFNSWLHSFGPKDPSKPQAHRMTGLKTMGQVAADFHTTVPLMIRETYAHNPVLSHGQRALVNHLDGVKPEPGTEIWVP